MPLSIIQMNSLPRCKNDRFLERGYYQGYDIIERWAFSNPDTRYAHAWSFFAVKSQSEEVAFTSNTIEGLKKMIDSSLNE